MMKTSVGGIFIRLLLALVFVGYFILVSYIALEQTGNSIWTLIVSVAGVIMIWRFQDVREIFFDLSSYLPTPLEGIVKIAGIAIFIIIVAVTIYSFFVTIPLLYCLMGTPNLHCLRI
jgi:hypothetical protein